MSTFIDEAVITVRSGSGGKGMLHFRREAHVPRGGPDGGDGGRGGSVVLEVDPHLNTLFHFRHRSRHAAEDGGHGGTSNKTGRSSPDLVVTVPPGTLIYDDATGDLVGDLTEPGQRLEVVPGGRGGRGNARFKNARNQTPRIAEKGEPGVERTLRLELKLIADIGLVGAPNAGKSTLLSAVTNAEPKIAPYPFTTLVPNLGVAALDSETTLVLADIPGLIEGAHKGVGLGHDFLRHIQRTRVLIHLIDGLSEDPVGDFYQINAELALYDPGLGEKPQLVAFNKCDLPEVAARAEAVREALGKKGYEVTPISAVAGTNVRNLLYQAAQALAETPEPDAPDELPVYRYETDPNAFNVEQISEDVFQVTGAAIERAAAMTYWEHDQSVRRFQRILETIGIDAALREAGVQPGHTVLVGEHELEWAE
ncbi:MAG TPA: GTPase ObgE [Anaerolineales bacterium]|nr:GTPase ObgE [Anaerolineales bacterium]